MIAHRAAIVLAGAASLAVFAVPGIAQIDETIVLNILRNCAQIDDPNARLACYDNNIRAAGAEPRNMVPGEFNVQGGRAPLMRDGAAGFGGEDVGDGRFAPRSQADEITATIAEVRQIGPGKWQFTLDSGAVWRFTDGVPNSYSPPRPGGEVEIMRGSLGSFLMRYRNQETVRVERSQ